MNNKKRVLVVSFQSLTANSAAGMARLGYFISEELHKRGMLKTFIVYSKGKFNTPFPSEPVSFFSRYFLFFLNNLKKYIRIQPHKFRFLQEQVFDWFCSFKISDNIDVLVSTNAYLTRTYKKAKKKGITIYFIPGNPDDNFIYHLMKEEQKKLNLHFTDAYTYKKRLNYFNKSLNYVDRIITMFPTAFDTYNNTVFRNKILNISGHLKPDFNHSEALKAANDETFNVAFLAHTVLLKGLHYLLEAWQQLMQQPDTGHMHLYIGGSIDGSVDSYIQKNFANTKNVHYKGHISNVPEFLRGKHLFVVPSLVEGEPVAALEAAHYGVPVIITDGCGAREFFEKEEEGWVVPIKDSNALYEAIIAASRNKEATKMKGLRAKQVLDNYSKDRLVTKIVDALQ